MAGVIDTNILLYGANADSDRHAAAAGFLQTAVRSADTWYLTLGIAYEFLRVSTHARVFPRPLRWSEALSFLRPLIAHERIGMLAAGAVHFELLAEVLGGLAYPAGNLFFDVRTVVLMREHGVRRIYTADRDFLQFKDIDVVDPL